MNFSLQKCLLVALALDAAVACTKMHAGGGSELQTASRKAADSKIPGPGYQQIVDELVTVSKVYPGAASLPSTITAVSAL